MRLLRIVASQHSVPSPDGRFIATVHESRLVVRSSTKSTILHSFPLPRDLTSTWRFLQWSGQSGAKAGIEDRIQINGKSPSISSRVLLANGDTVLIWDIGDSQWSAVINGATSNLGDIGRVCFGFTANEILVFSCFGVKVTIWSLTTSRGFAIRDPKSLPTCHDYRPRTGHLAILTRDGAHDTLILLAPGTYELIRSVDLTTVDAQGVKWSPDGQWLVVWDAASMGCKVSMYTPDGHLFRTYSGSQDADNIGMGAKTLKWSPLNSTLNIGGLDQSIVLLQRNTVSHLKSVLAATLDWNQVFPEHRIQTYGHDRRSSNRRMGRTNKRFKRAQLHHSVPAYLSASAEYRRICL